MDVMEAIDFQIIIAVKSAPTMYNEAIHLAEEFLSVYQTIQQHRQTNGC